MKSIQRKRNETYFVEAIAGKMNSGAPTIRFATSNGGNMNDLIVVQLDIARAALIQAKTIPAVKKILDAASAMKAYAKAQGMSDECIGYAHAVRYEALAKIGKMLKSMMKNRGGGEKGVGRSGKNAVTEVNHIVAAPTLAELGLDKRTSMIAQQVGELPDDVTEAIKEREVTLTEARRQQKKAKARKAPPLPLGTYRVLYADPPWKYGDQLTENYGGTQWHYPSMSIKELCDLPIKTLAQDNAVLFLWVTSPLLYEASPLIGAWGFKYKTSFVWDKVKHNMGHYNSVRHEFLLVCTRGSCLPDHGKLFDSVQTIERSAKHSEKPQEFRTIIETLYRGPRVELFARKAHAGWEAWGNEQL